MKKTYKLWEVLKALDKNPTLVFKRPENDDDCEIIVKVDNNNEYNENFINISTEFVEFNSFIDGYEQVGE